MSFKNNIICEEFSRQMWLYIDGSLSEEEKVFWNKHMNACSSCRGAFNEAEKGLSIYESLPLEDISDAEFNRMVQKATGKNSLLKRLSEYISFYFLFNKIAYGTASLAFIILLLFIFYHPASENPGKPEAGKTAESTYNNQANKPSEAIAGNNSSVNIKFQQNIKAQQEIMEWKGQKMKSKINQVGYSMDLMNMYIERNSAPIDKWTIKAAALDKEIERLEKEIENSSL